MNAEKQGEIRLSLSEGVVVAGPKGERRLGAVLSAIWRAADGETPLAGLITAAQKVDATADSALVWQGLDTLADAGLLQSRLAPPGLVMDRRALCIGIAAAAVVALTPRRSHAADKVEASGRKQEQEDKLKPQEQEDKLKPQEQEDKLKPQEQEDKLKGPTGKGKAAHEEKQKAPARENANKRGGEAAEQKNKVVAPAPPSKP